MVGLQTKPPSIAQAKVPAQQKVGFGGDGALSGDDVIDAGDWNLEVSGDPIRREPQGLEELLPEHLAGRDGGHKMCHRLLLQW
jgi:hypothetical protein